MILLPAHNRLSPEGERRKKIKVGESERKLPPEFQETPDRLERSYLVEAPPTAPDAQGAIELGTVGVCPSWFLS
jgi:hypothetical protein